MLPGRAFSACEGRMLIRLSGLARNEMWPL
jgi:hypothetical protein